MQSALMRFLEQIVDFTTNSHAEKAAVQAPELDMRQLVEQARQEWLNADRYFECVTDPELVDHAILLKDAAQKKYMYLLKLARSEGLRAFLPQELELVTEAADAQLLDTTPASASTSTD